MELLDRYEVLKQKSLTGRKPLTTLSHCWRVRPLGSPLQLARDIIWLKNKGFSDTVSELQKTITIPGNACSRNLGRELCHRRLIS